MLKIGVFGATGRVGKLVIDNLGQDEVCKLSVIYVRNELDFGVPPSVLVTNDFKTFLQSSDVVIDFSQPEAMEQLLEVAIKDVAKPMVIGTTGLNEHQKNLIHEASSKMPILYATNLSLGVAMLNRLVEMVSKTLKEFDIEIVEMHHRFKKDSPSGTALTLATTAANARDLNIDNVRVSGRNGNIGERTKDEIGVMSLRGGDIVGRHTVGFYNDGEFIELSHTATSRETFSKGAIVAAKWIANQKNGLYSINDCLGI